MANYHFGPYHYDTDISEVYTAAGEYFLRGGQGMHISSKHFDDDDRFYIDFIRPYSFVANEFKATVHLQAKTNESGGTDITFDIKSQDDEPRLEKNLYLRICDGIQIQVDKLNGQPLPTGEKSEEEKRKEKRHLIIGLIVAAIIIIGTIPISLNPANWGF